MERTLNIILLLLKILSLIFILSFSILYVADKIIKDNKKDIMIDKMGEECALAILTHNSNLKPTSIDISRVITNYGIPQEIQLDVISSCNIHCNKTIEALNKAK